MLNETTEMRDRLLTVRGETILKATELLSLPSIKAHDAAHKSALVNILLNQSIIMGALEMLLKQNEHPATA